MNQISTKTQKRTRRHARIRSTIKGTEARPRVSIFKSNTELYAQLIDDTKSVTLASASTKDVKKGTLKERAVEAGKMLADKAKEKGVGTVVFDRGGFTYIGIIKDFADSARANGLAF